MRPLLIVLAGFATGALTLGVASCDPYRCGGGPASCAAPPVPVRLASGRFTVTPPRLVLPGDGGARVADAEHVVELQLPERRVRERFVRGGRVVETTYAFSGTPTVRPALSDEAAYGGCSTEY